MAKHIVVTHNLNCRSDFHTHHLCYMAARGFNRSDEHYFHALTKEPKFKCQCCGRVAKSQENLCQPLRLYDSRY